jgi:hypothetical protein
MLRAAAMSWSIGGMPFVNAMETTRRRPRGADGVAVHTVGEAATRLRMSRAR